GAEGSTQPAAAFAAQMAALNGHDCAGRIGAVRVPTLVLAASDDIIIRPELSRELFDLLAPGVGTWAVVPGGTPPSGRTRGRGIRPSSISSARSAPPRKVQPGHDARGEVRHRQAGHRDGALPRLAGTAAARSPGRAGPPGRRGRAGPGGAAGGRR